jgi:hypothetical protein
MQELTFAEFCQMPMELVWHISTDKQHLLSKFNKETGVLRHTVTRINRRGEFGKSTTTYSLEGDSRTFTAPDQVYVAYMEKVCGVKA